MMPPLIWLMIAERIHRASAVVDGEGRASTWMRPVSASTATSATSTPP